MKKAIFNGEVIDEQKALLPIDEKAVWFDFGVYESIKVIQGKPFYSEKHIERFFHSAKLISMQMGFEKEKVQDWVTSFCKEENLENALLRLFAYGDTEQNKKARIYMFALGLTFYPNTAYSQGETAVTYNGERFLPQAKSFNMLVNFLAYESAKKQNAIEALLIDREDCVTEGTRSNLFIIEKEKVITPPAESVLAGVTRDLLREWAAEKKFLVSEERIKKERIFAASEVFITSTSMNVMPITQIDGKKIGDGQVGQVTHALHLLFREKQREYLRGKANA